MHKLQSSLQERIETVFENHPYTENYEIKAIEGNGIVYLLGKVDTHDHKQLVEKVVRSLKGVSVIINQISVDGKNGKG